MDEHKPRRGELRIYLGAAPGVGKTHTMLAEAHRRLRRGTDVVVGLVETHGRVRTAAQLNGLEVVPRKVVRHRGAELTEMDLDALLARRPEVALVDELAHTNAPGSRNGKRWEDVEELLEAGIDVLSTVNIQHLASLNDVVHRITGVRQQETVPDAVVRRAEQVQLIDLTPEELRGRLAHGEVYAEHKVEAALAKYFRAGNLTALRQLAILWLADQVDDEPLPDLESRERVVVAVTGGPESETMIRRAQRIAAKAGAELLVVNVLSGGVLPGPSPATIASCRRIAKDLGATFHSVVGDEVPAALLEFARGVHATQLVLGTSRRGRLARLFDEGIGAAVVQDAGPIDVHLITHDEVPRGPRRAGGRTALSRDRRLLGWALALLLPALVTALGLWSRAEHGAFSTELVGFMLVTCVVAVTGGLGPALCAAFAGGGLYLFAEAYRDRASTPENVITLVALVIVAVVVALVVDRAAGLAELATRARREAGLLAEYSRTVLSEDNPLPRLLAKVRTDFGLDSVALLERRDDGDWTHVAGAGTRTGAEDARVAVTPDVHLALHGRTLPAADQRVLEAAAGQALLALRHQRLAAHNAGAQEKAERTEARAALLAAVGHDLRAPLATLTTAVAGLPDHPGTATLKGSAGRLTGVLTNLLDSSLVATGSLAPDLVPVRYDEVVAAALADVDDRAVLSVAVDAGLPPVLADPDLLTRVVADLLHNALRHGRLHPRRVVDVDGDGRVAEDEPEIALRASAHGGHVELRVVDHGPGRSRKDARGSGLDLPVAKGFTEAMGGTVAVEDTPGGGLTVVVSLPRVRLGSASSMAERDPHAREGL
ncbi:two-component system sensor histidine kinase KdpD [Crossiella equi]|uniref:histidine kinase n=1 Tax=Crossiella equi TaxID=130796 RepID=A0ABS5A7G3_9PSEU|nr:ATP-binding protein [Crossiella equi]MBP2472251.1 two-component system sensor histidine kinase KdpD [Crossiella equi]